MSILRVSFWSAVGLILLTAIAWSILIIFLQTVSVTAVRVGKQVQEGLNPIHLGRPTESVCVPKVGIPLNENSGRTLGGRDFTQWLQASKGVTNDAPFINEASDRIDTNSGANLRVVPLSNGPTETVLPIEPNGSGTILVLIAIPPEQSGSLRVKWGTETDGTAPAGTKPVAIPASGQ